MHIEYDAYIIGSNVPTGSCSLDRKICVGPYTLNMIELVQYRLPNVQYYTCNKSWKSKVIFLIVYISKIKQTAEFNTYISKFINIELIPILNNILT